LNGEVARSVWRPNWERTFMRIPFRHALPWSLILVLSLVAGTSVAAPVPDQQKFVKDRQAQLSDLVRKGADAEIDRVFAETLDYEAIARDSLGDAWGGLTAQQQAQFQCLLRSIVARAYRRDLRRTLDYGISFEGTEQLEKGMLVKTVAKSRTNEREDPIDIAYVVHRVGNQWRIRDIVTEGSSMVASYQVQFRKALKRKGFDDLVKKMKDKLGPDAACD
jgi:phospholipid transport system substrate-binding protein